MALSFGNIEATILIQIGNQEPVEVGTLTVPLRIGVERTGPASFEGSED